VSRGIESGVFWVKIHGSNWEMGVPQATRKDQTRKSSPCPLQKYYPAPYGEVPGKKKRKKKGGKRNHQTSNHTDRRKNNKGGGERTI